MLKVYMFMCTRFSFHCVCQRDGLSISREYAHVKSHSARSRVLTVAAVAVAVAAVDSSAIHCRHFQPRRNISRAHTPILAECGREAGAERRHNV